MSNKQFCRADFKLSKNVLKSCDWHTNNAARGRQSCSYSFWKNHKF